MKTLTGVMSQKSKNEYLESCRARYRSRNRVYKDCPFLTHIKGLSLYILSHDIFMPVATIAKRDGAQVAAMPCGCPVTSEPWCCDGCVVALLDATAQNAVADFADHFRKQQPEVRAFAIVGGCDVFHAVGVCR